MAFLTLNGIDVAVTACAQERSHAYDYGARGYTAQYRGQPRYSKRAWNFTSTPVAVATSEAIQGLVEGRGVVIPMDTNQTTRSGLPVATTFGSLGMVATTHPNHGQGWAFSGTQANNWTITPAPPTWTTLASVHTHMGVGNGWAFQNVIRRSDNVVYVNGVVRTDNEDLFVNAASQGFTMVSSGNLSVASKRHLAQVGWVASQAKTLSSYLFVSGVGVFKCSVAGTTGTVQPTFNTATYGATTTDGTVTWKCTDGLGAGGVGDGRQVFAALVWLPWLLPAEWAAQADARFNLASVWSDLPHIEASGTFSGTGLTLVCAGEVTDVQAIGGAGTSLEAVSFTLREV